MNYEKYKWFFTSSGKLVFGGKNAEQNEDLMENIEEQDVIMHTKEAGSPFVVLKGKFGKKDLKEAAIFCAAFSKQWKAEKKEIEVHIFKGWQVVKEKGQKKGTFSVLGKIGKVYVRPKLVLTFQKRKLRAVPPSAAKKILLEIRPGKLEKEKVIGEIEKILKKKKIFVSKQEIEQAIPAKCKIKCK